MGWAIGDALFWLGFWFGTGRGARLWRASRVDQLAMNAGLSRHQGIDLLCGLRSRASAGSLTVIKSPIIPLPEM